MKLDVVSVVPGKSPALPAVTVLQDEDIDPRLLDEIPDVLDEPQHVDVEGLSEGSAGVSHELSALLGDLQAEMAALLAQEFVRVEDRVAWLFADRELAQQ